MLVFALIGWSVTSLRNRSTTHYLRRLWPETAVELARYRRGPTADNWPDEDSREKTSA
ncbi:hypothetical protein [Cryobacterium sp. TMS1-20-1]|uniref:hypothetical protein n=1 Tax=Cryobacterium sp. TMS1-20-1 TaxID=1259223 RepID=UPI00141A7F04|nr:hypothetical protein [Cryobacterium sp. TMS1-20-1]